VNAWLYIGTAARYYLKKAFDKPNIGEEKNKRIYTDSFLYAYNIDCYIIQK